MVVYTGFDLHSRNTYLGIMGTGLKSTPQSRSKRDGEVLPMGSASRPARYSANLISLANSVAPIRRDLRFDKLREMRSQAGSTAYAYLPSDCLMAKVM